MNNPRPFVVAKNLQLLLTPVFIVVSCAIWAVAAVGIKIVGVPQPKPVHVFSGNFQDM